MLSVRPIVGRQDAKPRTARSVLSAAASVGISYITFSTVLTVNCAVVAVLARKVGSTELADFLGGFLMGVCLSVALGICLTALRSIFDRRLRAAEVEAFGVTSVILVLSLLLVLGARSMLGHLNTDYSSNVWGFAIGLAPVFLLLLVWDLEALAEVFGLLDRSGHRS